MLLFGCGKEGREDALQLKLPFSNPSLRKPSSIPSKRFCQNQPPVVDSCLLLKTVSGGRSEGSISKHGVKILLEYAGRCAVDNVVLVVGGLAKHSVSDQHGFSEESNKI